MKKPWDRGIIYWFANNSVAANLLMMVLLIGGVYSAWNMKKEMFPATSVNQVLVSMAYPGAAPDEVEKGICVKVRDRTGRHRQNHLCGQRRVCQSQHRNWQ